MVTQPLVFDPATTRIGWIGTGVMGASMAGHLIAAGYPLTVYNRTKSKADPLVQRGATLCSSPADVARQSDVVFTMVGYPSDVSSVILGTDRQTDEQSNDRTDPQARWSIVDAIRGDATTRCRMVIDMTTSAPSLAVTIAQTLLRHHVHSLDAPVSGGDIGARGATLSIMVGGSKAAFDAASPLFDILGKTVVHQGDAGAGQHTKMVNQTLVAANMIGVCEAMLYADAAGLDAATMLRSVSSGAATNWALINLAPKILDGDFAPGFYVEHFIKDMQIALDEAARMKIAMPGLALVHQLYVAVAAQGHARSGTQALAIALRTLSGR